MCAQISWVQCHAFSSTFVNGIAERGKRKKELVKRFAGDEAGLELSEYALMASLLVVGLIAILVTLRSAISNTFTVLTNTIGSNS